jgi:glycine betaine/proline transport system ATP-binding protein
MDYPKAKIRVEHLIKIYGENCSTALRLFRQGADRATILKITGQVLGIAGVSFTIDRGEFFLSSWGCLVLENRRCYAASIG